jgi:hypothetical protein
VIALFLFAAASSEPSGFVDDNAPSSAPASAPAAPEVVEPTPAVAPLVSQIPWYQSLKVSGFIDADFAFIAPGQANTFFVGEAEVDIEKKLFDVAGLRLDMNILRRPPWDPQTYGTLNGQIVGFGITPDDLIEQAYAEYFPLGEDGPRLRLGKYNALVGYERQDPTDRLTASESLVFIHGSPANFTGLAFQMPLPAGLAVVLHLAYNGWDQGITDKKTKSIGGQLGWHWRFAKPVELQTAFTLLYGNERFGDDKNGRLAGFFSLSLQVNDNFIFAGETTYARDSGAGRAPDGTVPGNLTADWFGLSLWVRYRILSWLAVTVRYDDFNDPSRVRGLAASAADYAAGGETERQQVTTSVAATIVPGAIARLEYTGDFLQSRDINYLRPLTRTDRIVLQAVYAF